MKSVGPPYRRPLGDLPETDQRRGIAAGFLQGDDRPFRQRAAGEHVLERIERSAHVAARFGRPGREPGARGEEQLTSQVASGAAARTLRIERAARHVRLELQAQREGPAFRQLLGRSPIRYLTEWRMHLAEDLLATADITIFDLARRVGYESEEAFSRAFKRERGLSPSHWRAARL